MVKKLHFSYNSPENFVKLLVTIRIENRCDNRTIFVYQKIFNGINGDRLFLNFMEEEFPTGATIGENELKVLFDKVVKYLNTDKQCRKLFTEYDKSHCSSYIYSKALDKLYPADFGEHIKKAVEACQDFFAGVNDITVEDVRLFIRNNLEVKSDNTSINTILNDADYITRCCVF